jgi:hypothetical protein
VINNGYARQHVEYAAAVMEGNVEKVKKCLDVHLVFVDFRDEVIIRKLAILCVTLFLFSHRWVVLH